MNQDLTIAILQLIPGLIWAVIGLFVVIRLYRPFREEILPRLTGVQLMGLRIDMSANEIQKAVESVKRPGVDYAPTVGASLLSRADRASELLHGSCIAWVDDHPETNLAERRLLSRMGVFVEPVSTAAEVATRARMGGPTSWDVVISDAARPADPDAGVSATVARLRNGGHTGPVIFYIGSVDRARGVPADVFGLTNRPDELVHLVVDALERRASPTDPLREAAKT